MAVPKSGALTPEELLEVWKGAVDAGYRDPLIEAGEGEGLEVHTQALAQFARVSTAIDRTTQAMFLCPWSGQTNPPAAGAARSTVTLSFARTLLLDRALVLGAGEIFVEEETTDFGGEGGVVVATDRRYVLTSDLVFHPGETGPFEVEAEAETSGVGYDNPLPGTIRRIAQPGAVFENDLATVIVQAGAIDGGGALQSSNSVLVTTPNQPDTFVPEHVGQYVRFVAGANAGLVGRVTQFEGPDLAANPPIGSKVFLEWVYSVEGVVAGTFEVGERITRGAPADLFGRVLAVGGTPSRMTFAYLANSGAALAPGDVLTGTLSGATLTVSTVLDARDFVSEAPVGGVGGAAWRMLDWAVSWGLSATNAESPSGGLAPWLDELGFERNLGRAPGEPDSLYRQRSKAIADVVSPNAVRRALSRTLGSIPWCFREVGTEGLRGFFYDGDNSPPSATPHGAQNDAYDVDSIIVTGGPAVGTFVFQEPAELEDTTTGDNYAVGYFGRIDGGTKLVFIRRNGSLPSPLPAGVRVRGLVSGATFPVTAEAPNAAKEARRFNVYLDYEQFRGFFLVCLPPLGLGEYGFAYDGHPSNAYDAGGDVGNFYDGRPYLNAQVYGRVFQAIDEVRAGGVSFDLCLDDGPCP